MQIVLNGWAAFWIGLFLMVSFSELCSTIVSIVKCHTAKKMINTVINSATKAEKEEFIKGVVNDLKTDE